MKRLVSVLLNLCFVLFLACGALSLVDDSLVLLLGLHLLMLTSELLFFVALLVTLLVYGLMGLTPVVPKRVFLPIAFFYAADFLVVFPALIYCYDQVLVVDWILSFCQIVVGLGILWWLRGELNFRWPLVEDKHLGDRRFSWLNLSGFLLVNVLVLPLALVAYLALCGVLAVNHFSGGFLALHPGGLTVQVRDYVRSDGKKIELVPMAHIADASFYRKISQSFPSNSVILMEGVTDRKHLLTNQINYARMAHVLHLSQQETKFEPAHGEMVMADVDVDQFSTNTIHFLNLAMLFHSKGVNPATVQAALEYSPPPDFLDQLTRDLIRNRNRHLLAEIHDWLPRSDDLIVPWGVAHIPQISKEIQKSGFHPVKTREYTLIRFHFFGNKSHAAEPEKATGKSQ